MKIKERKEIGIFRLLSKNLANTGVLERIVMIKKSK